MGKSSKRRNEDIKKIWNNWPEINWQNDKKKLDEPADKCQDSNKIIEESAQNETE